MAKIFISVVGNRDPFWFDKRLNQEIAGPILTAVPELKPDHVCLIYTDHEIEKEEEANKLKQVLAEKHRITTELIPVTLPKPYLYETVISAFQQVANRLKQDHLEDELMIGISSGTPQMQWAWLMLISQGLLPATPYYVPDPQLCSSDDPAIQKVSVNFLLEDSLIKSARQNFQNSNFHSAGEIFRLLAEMISVEDRQKRIKQAANFCEALALWDNYRLGEAKGKLQGLVKHNLGLTPLFEQLNALIEVRNAEETILVFTDLYGNADRSFSRGQYTDCLARCIRIYEGVLKWWLFNRYGIPDNLNKMNDEVRKETLSFLGAKGLTPDKKGHLMKHILGVILTEKFKDENILKWDPIMKGFGEIRDKSIVAHGTQEIPKEKALKALQLLNEILLRCGCDLTNYPFGCAKISDLGEELFKNI